MHGGMHGAHDQMGTLVERGWLACGYAETIESEPERTWAELARS